MAWHKLLYVVRGCAVAFPAVETNHVGAPRVDMVLIDENRGVAVHDAHVGIVFHTLHVDGFSQCRIQMSVDTEILCNGIFSYIYLVT